MPGEKAMALSNSDAYGIFISNGDFGLIRQVLSPAEEANRYAEEEKPRFGNS